MITSWFPIMEGSNRVHPTKLVEVLGLASHLRRNAC